MQEIALYVELNSLEALHFPGEVYGLALRDL